MRSGRSWLLKKLVFCALNNTCRNHETYLLHHPAVGAVVLYLVRSLSRGWLSSLKIQRINNNKVPCPTMHQSGLLSFVSNPDWRASDFSSRKGDLLPTSGLRVNLRTCVTNTTTKTTFLEDLKEKEKEKERRRRHRLSSSVITFLTCALCVRRLRKGETDDAGVKDLTTNDHRSTVCQDRCSIRTQLLITSPPAVVCLNMALITTLRVHVIHMGLPRRRWVD